MGFEKFIIKTLLPDVRAVELIKDIADHGIVDGIKENRRREIQEDNPFTASVYKAGKLDGKKEGYVTASAEYEKKLFELADRFLTQKNLFEQQRDELKKLIDEYEKEIERLEQKQKRTEDENTYLQLLLQKERALKKIAE